MQDKIIDKYTCIYILVFLEIGYFLAPKKELCSENKGIAVTDVNSCKKAMYEIKKEIHDAKFTKTGLGTGPNWPKGCYLHSASSYVYFNNNSIGSTRNHLAQQICKPKGIKYFHLTFFISLLIIYCILWIMRPLFL